MRARVFHMPSPVHVRGLQVVRVIQGVMNDSGLGGTPQAQDLAVLLRDPESLGVIYASVLASMEVLVALRERWALEVEQTERLVGRGLIPRVVLEHVLEDPMAARIRFALLLTHAWALEVPEEVIYDDPDDDFPGGC